MSSKLNDSSNPADEAKGPAANRQSLPFEPKNRRSTGGSASEKSLPIATVKAEKIRAANSRKESRRSESGIPQVVSRRMMRRMAAFCGVPTALGMSTFVVSYLIVSRDLLDLPTYAVLLVSLGWFGLGVVGLTYGVLSASWDEDAAGSAIGWSEFTTNWGRMTDTWRSNAAQAKADKGTGQKPKSGSDSSSSGEE